MTEPVYTVSDFVAVCNQILDVSFGSVQITGELANIRVSKNKWVYFDLKDEFSSVRFFGTVYALPGPMEDGMMLAVRGTPQLHPRFGFNVTVQNIQLEGAGTIKKAASLLEQKLEKEGLFATERKRSLPRMPERIGLITSHESAAYGDFIKIIKARWGLEVLHYDVQVQGENAPDQIVQAIEYFSRSAETPQVLVIIRGGGNADDLQAFSSEIVTRAVAGSRIPTLVAVGHERDVSLAERAADQRASTPSNAAELLVPDKAQEIQTLEQYQKSFSHIVVSYITQAEVRNKNVQDSIRRYLDQRITSAEQVVAEYRQKLALLDPKNTLNRGFAIVRDEQQKIITSASKLKPGQQLQVRFRDGKIFATVENKE